MINLFFWGITDLKTGSFDSLTVHSANSVDPVMAPLWFCGWVGEGKKKTQTHAAFLPSRATHN